MSTKANLKAAKAALDAGDYSKTVVETQIVLASNAHNYIALLLQARALEKQGKLDDAVKQYQAAASSKPEDSQAWQGLCSVYEGQGPNKVDEYHEAAVKAAEIFANADDKHRCQTVVDKLTSFVKANGTEEQQKRALELLLPGSPIYDCLEGRIPHPAHTYIRLAEIVEAAEARYIRRQIDERRTRLHAKITQVADEVKREALGSPELDNLYQNVINWTNDYEIRRQYEEKMFDRAYNFLLAVPQNEKQRQLGRVLNLAEGMVIVKHPFQRAWDLWLDTRDSENLKDLDVNLLRQYIQFFPDAGLTKILVAWLSSDHSPFPPMPIGVAEDETPKEVTAEEGVVMVTEGLAAAQESPLAHRIGAEYYQHAEDDETAASTASAGRRIASTEARKLGVTLTNTEDALDSIEATFLVYYQAPRHHVEARAKFEGILRRKPKWTAALIGLGLIYEEQQEYDKAVQLLTQALAQDATNIKVGAELAWCRALCGQYVQAREELEACLAQLKPDDMEARELRAEILYRIGICMWNIDTSKSARKSRDGAYSRFLSAVKTNINFAPAYTSLGYYYLDYAKDKKRARQCFQKAFELSPAETDAAEKLAQSFANQGDWEIVEVIAKRVVDTGRARPPPGSKRKALSWPYSALGVVQMNKQDYSQAITNFLAALRISPDDYQSYVGLGESYHNSGRYNSALRTFSFALDPPAGTPMTVNGEVWFARYMLANVHRELGDFEEAIGGLRGVLNERPAEFGVLISLLQTYVEKSWTCSGTGLFGQAVEAALQALETAHDVARIRPHAFNLWKAVGDACLVFTDVQSDLGRFPRHQTAELLRVELVEGMYKPLTEIDSVTLDVLDQAKEDVALIAGILAYKRAITSCADDKHAQAVSWYNLGWAEYQAYVSKDSKTGKDYLRAAVWCFKRAIECEARNAELWNALGVVTSTLNPKVAQHSFVRSLHLNELNAKVWANLGVLYLLQNDFELARSAFGRSQSTDPTYAHAWVGQGLLALMAGDAPEALNQFTHAFEIAESASVISKRQYALSSFDHLVSIHTKSTEVTKLIQPLFALEQLRVQRPFDLPYRHVAALFLERVGDYMTAAAALTEICATAEAQYEESEDLASLARFAHAKTDLARCQLALGTAYAEAAENAETALDLTNDTDNSGLDADSRRRLRLSAHVTAGLASHKLGDSPTAVRMFRDALLESDSNPDAVCLLVKVLWANGGTQEKRVAREQLFAVVEKHPDHVGAMTLLGAIAALEDDDETLSAVKDDLELLRVKAGLSVNDEDEVERLLAGLAALGADGDVAPVATAQTAVLLRPDHAAAWSELAELSGDEYAAAMALKTAQKAIPPFGEMDAAELAETFAGAGTVGDAQRAAVLAPWKSSGWIRLSEGLA